VEMVAKMLPLPHIVFPIFGSKGRVILKQVCKSQKHILRKTKKLEKLLIITQITIQDLTPSGDYIKGAPNVRIMCRQME
jgi:hypothetical protein